MRLATATLALTLMLGACGGGSTVPHAPAAPAGKLPLAASANPWVFLNLEQFSPDGYAAIGYILAYAPAPQYGKPMAITKGLHNPQQVATDSRNHLFVLDYPAPSSSSSQSLSSVRVVAPPYTGAPRTLRVKGVTSLALDASDDLFLLKSNEIVELKPPYKSVALKFSVASGVRSFAVDAHDDVFVPAAPGVVEYSPPSYARRATIRIPNCQVSLAANASDRLFVGTDCGKTASYVTDYVIAGSRLTRAHPPVSTCSVYGFATPAVNSTGDVFVSTWCGALEIHTLPITLTKLTAFGSGLGVLAVSDSGRLFDGGSSAGHNAALLIGSVPYSSLQQTVGVARYDSISSIALSH